VILLSGYRFGLDDVILDGQLIHTVHGSRKAVFETLTKMVESEGNWWAYTASRKWRDLGDGTEVSEGVDKVMLAKREGRVSTIVKALREIANEIEGWRL
jgi:hypothetical protein